MTLGTGHARKTKTPLMSVVARTPEAVLTDTPEFNSTTLIASAVAQHLQVAPPSERQAILAHAQSLKTHAEALAYLKEVYTLVRAARVKAGVTRSAAVRAHAGVTVTREH